MSGSWRRSKLFEEGEQDGWRYIVMEFVMGGDLSRLVGADAHTLLPVFVQLASTLDYIHSRRIVHRDLEPANMLIVPGEPLRPKLADFGIAHMTGDALGKLTATGAVLGTIDYMSPEQALGESASPRSDLYARGCMIFTLFARRPPFEGTSFERLAARTKGPAPRLASLVPSIPPELDRLAARLLAREPTERPQSALEVAHTLATVLAALGGGALAESEVAALLAPRVGGFLYRPSLSGRDTERQRVRTLATATTEGATETRVVLLCGAAGLG